MPWGIRYREGFRPFSRLLLHFLQSSGHLLFERPDRHTMERQGLRSLWDKVMKFFEKNYRGYWFSSLCLILLVIHGHFKIFQDDKITIFLLALACAPFVLPFAARFLEMLKIGDWELTFRSLSETDKTLVFLRAIASEKKWTFYEPREDPREEETYSGEPFCLLAQSLLKAHRQKFVSALEEWLVADDTNLRWFASEVIGYFEISELRDALFPHVDGEDVNKVWPTWMLNYLWAYSKFNEYQELFEFWKSTENDQNKRWAKKAFRQMWIAHEKHRPAIKNFFPEISQKGEIKG